MTDDSKLILITEFIEQKVRKEQELEYYLKELDNLKEKIGYLRNEVALTTTIINIIKNEQVYDINSNILPITEDKLVGEESKINE
jgi:hypothetical protein|tara:strand:- start:1989 stop:2243 length:255 start_codon:yes stop_codon:yes gene_type:complete